MSQWREWKIPLITLVINNDAPQGLDKVTLIERAAFDAAVAELEKAGEAIAQCWACIEHLRETAPNDYLRVASISTMNDADQTLASLNQFLEKVK